MENVNKTWKNKNSDYLFNLIIKSTQKKAEFFFLVRLKMDDHGIVIVMSWSFAVYTTPSDQLQLFQNHLEVLRAFAKF